MADLGTLTTFSRPLAAVRPLAVWAVDQPSLIAVPINGYLAGTVRIDGVPAANQRVALYYRPTQGFIDRRRSAADGSYRFDYLEAGQAKYYVVALGAAADSNTVVLDHLVPVAL